MVLRAKYMNEQGLQPNGVPKGIKTFQEYEELIAKQAAEKAWVVISHFSSYFPSLF